MNRYSLNNFTPCFFRRLQLHLKEPVYAEQRRQIAITQRGMLLI